MYIDGLEGTKMKRNYKHIYYPESRFGGFTNDDETIMFYTRLISLLDDSKVVLDIGCGRGKYIDDRIPIRRNLQDLRERCKRVIGIDVDEAAASNPGVDEFHLLVDNHWPIEDASIDVCLSNFVLEHVDNPHIFFAECERVLKKGGYLFLRTSNLLSYLGLFAKVIPKRFHNDIISLVQPRRKLEDAFSTLYRCNTVWKIRRMLAEHGFDHYVFGYQTGPGYLAFSHLSYFLGVVYLKLAPSILKNDICVFAQKR